MRYVVILAVLLAACATDAGTGELPEPTAGSEPPATAPDGESITGTFGGDAQLEGGCAWVEDGGTRWQVEWPQGYQVAFDPLTLAGPDGEIAGEGDTLTVHGSEVPDAMTTCQVGPLWAATSVTAGGR